MSTVKGNDVPMVVPCTHFFLSDVVKGMSKQRAPIAKSDPKIHVGMSDSEAKITTRIP